jgi:hypothetical protein
MVHYYLFIVVSFLIGMYGIYLSISGFQGTFHRHPVYNFRQGLSLPILLFYFVFMTVLVSTFGVEYIEVDNKNISIGSVILIFLGAAILALLFGVLPRLRKTNTSTEVTIHGINKKLLEILRQALTKEKIMYQEMNENFSLPELNAMIYTSFVPSVNYATLRIVPNDNLPLLEKIVQELKEYDRNNNDHFALKISLMLQALGGAILFLAGLILAILFYKIVAA